MLIARSKFFAELSKRAMASSASVLAESASAKNTVNESEVSKFRQMSDTWWDPNGPGSTQTHIFCHLFSSNKHDSPVP
jgi:hypothetical protein